MRAVLLVGATLAVALPALADGGAPAGEPPQVSGAADAGGAVQGLSPKGRFLVSVSSDELEDYRRRYAVQQARLGAVWRGGFVKAEVEADLAETSVLNDAYVQLRGGPARLTVGRFKAPFSSLLLASVWDRPVLRGSRVEKQVEDLGFGGRDVGVAASGKIKRALGLELAAGLFEGTSVSAGPAPEDGYARASIAPLRPLRLGVAVARRALLDGGAGDAAEVDATLALGDASARVEGLTARDDISGTRLSGLVADLAYRLPAGARITLEPAVGAQLLRTAGAPDVLSGAATVGALVDGRFRVRAGVEQGPAAPAEPARTAVLLQAGVQL